MQSVSAANAVHFDGSTCAPGGVRLCALLLRALALGADGSAVLLASALLALPYVYGFSAFPLAALVAFFFRSASSSRTKIVAFAAAWGVASAHVFRRTQQQASSDGGGGGGGGGDAVSVAALAAVAFGLIAAVVLVAVSMLAGGQLNRADDLVHMLREALGAPGAARDNARALVLYMPSDALQLYGITAVTMGQVLDAIALTSGATTPADAPAHAMKALGREVAGRLIAIAAGRYGQWANGAVAPTAARAKAFFDKVEGRVDVLYKDGQFVVTLEDGAGVSDMIAFANAATAFGALKSVSTETSPYYKGVVVAAGRADELRAALGVLARAPLAEHAVGGRVVVFPADAAAEAGFALAVYFFALRLGAAAAADVKGVSAEASPYNKGFIARRHAAAAAAAAAAAPLQAAAAAVLGDAAESARLQLVDDALVVRPPDGAAPGVRAQFGLTVLLYTLVDDGEYAIVSLSSNAGPLERGVIVAARFIGAGQVQGATAAGDIFGGMFPGLIVLPADGGCVYIRLPPGASAASCTAFAFRAIVNNLRHDSVYVCSSLTSSVGGRVGGRGGHEVADARDALSAADAALEAAPGDVAAAAAAAAANAAFYRLYDAHIDARRAGELAARQAAAAAARAAVAAAAAAGAAGGAVGDYVWVNAGAMEGYPLCGGGCNLPVVRWLCPAGPLRDGHARLPLIGHDRPPILQALVRSCADNHVRPWAVTRHEVDRLRPHLLRHL